MTEGVRARILKAGGEILTFDQLALQAPRGQNTVLLQGRGRWGSSLACVTTVSPQAPAKHVRRSSTLERHLVYPTATPSELFRLLFTQPSFTTLPPGHMYVVRDASLREPVDEERAEATRTELECDVCPSTVVIMNAENVRSEMMPATVV